jgi:hypothetical protein
MFLVLNFQAFYHFCTKLILMMRSPKIVLIGLIFTCAAALNAQMTDSLTQYLSKTESYLQYEPDGQYLQVRYWVHRAFEGIKTLDNKDYKIYKMHYQVRDTDTIRTEEIYEHFSDQSIEWRTDKDGYIIKIPLSERGEKDGIIDGLPGKIISRPLFDAAERNVDPSLVPVLHMLENDTNVYVLFRKELQKIELLYAPDRMMKLMIGEGFSELAIKDNVIDAFIPKMLMKKGEKAELTFRQPIVAENGKDIFFEKKLLLRATYLSDSLIDDMPSIILQSERYDYDNEVFVGLKNMYIAKADSGFLIDGSRFVHLYKTGTSYRIVDPQAEPYFNYYDFSDEPTAPFAELNIARKKKINQFTLIYHTQWKSNSDYQVTFVNGFPLPFYENASFQGEISYLELDGAKYGMAHKDVKCIAPGMLRKVELNKSELILNMEFSAKSKITVSLKNLQSNEDVELINDKEFQKGKKDIKVPVSGIQTGSAYKLIFTARSGKTSHSQRVDLVSY